MSTVVFRKKLSVIVTWCIYMEARFIDRRFVWTTVQRVGATMCMHKGKDGSVRQLCGPGIAPESYRKMHKNMQEATSSAWKK